MNEGVLDMIKWAGWLITLCGVGHTVGSLVQTLPHYAGDWFRWALWDGDLVTMNHTTAGFWYSAFSFGPLLILIGLTVVWMERHRITPPAFIAWSAVGWTVVTAVLSGPSPLLLLIVAAALLLAGARRADREARGRQPHPV